MDKMNEKIKIALAELKEEYLTEHPNSGYEFDGFFLIDYNAGLVRFANNIPEKYKIKITEIFENSK